MKTRIITAVVGLAVLAVVLAFFDTILFDLVLAAICLLAIHEVFTAMGFGKKQWYLYAAAVPFTMLLMLSSSGAARAALLAVGFLTVLFYNVVLITHDKTLVSPNNTVEGAIGGGIGSVVIGLLATIIYSALSGRFASLTVAVTARHYIIIAAMGAVASVLGILGDLFASAVKRQVGIKDYGTIFPGHGGILDRFDSVMFIAPLVSIVVRYFFYVFQ